MAIKRPPVALLLFLLLGCRQVLDLDEEPSSVDDGSDAVALPTDMGDPIDHVLPQDGARADDMAKRADLTVRRSDMTGGRGDLWSSGADLQTAANPDMAAGCTCQGEAYNLDSYSGNGCEAQDSVPPGHSLGSAARRPDHACSDATEDTFSGRLLSDACAHPGLPNFNSTTGSTPDYWVVKGLGMLSCFNDYHATLTISGGDPNCSYGITVQTDLTTTGGMVRGNGTTEVHSPGTTNQWSSGSDIVFVVEKGCPLVVGSQKAVTYVVKFHL